MHRPARVLEGIGKRRERRERRQDRRRDAACWAERRRQGVREATHVDVLNASVLCSGLCWMREGSGKRRTAGQERQVARHAEGDGGPETAGINVQGV
jgi:hypothetical protein